MCIHLVDESLQSLTSAMNSFLNCDIGVETVQPVMPCPSCKNKSVNTNLKTSVSLYLAGSSLGCVNTFQGYIVVSVMDIVTNEDNEEKNNI